MSTKIKAKIDGVGSECRDCRHKETPSHLAAIEEAAYRCRLFGRWLESGAGPDGSNRAFFRCRECLAAEANE